MEGPRASASAELYCIQSVTQETANSRDQFGRGFSADPQRSFEGEGIVQLAGEGLLLIRGDHPLLGFEVFCRGNLMIVALFPEAGLSGHNDDGFACFEGGNDRPDAGVRNDQASLFDKIFELGRIDEIGKSHMFRKVFRFADLRKNFAVVARRAPFVDGADQAIKRSLQTDGYEDQRTAPA